MTAYQPANGEYSPSSESARLNQKWLEQVGPALFPAGAILAVQRYDRGVALPPVNLAGLERAVEKRQREFTAGRLAAKVALEKLAAFAGGVARAPFTRIVATAVPSGADRSPTWPPGIAGSITHTAELSACVVARKADVSALGIDLEIARAVQPEIWDSVLTSREIAALTNRPVAERSALATLIFSAKEAFFKMQYPLTGEWVEFHAAEVQVRERGGTFELVCSESAVTGVLGQRSFAGRHAVGSELIVTALSLIRPEK